MSARIASALRAATLIGRLRATSGPNIDITQIAVDNEREVRGNPRGVTYIQTE